MGHLRATLLAVAGCVLLCSLFQVQAFTDSFEGSWTDRWSHSTQEKYSGRFVAEAPEGHPGVSLKVPEKAKHYGLATVLEEPVDPAEGLVLQYSLKLANGLTCGGGYLKFLTEGLFAPEELKDDTPYTVMFGPDKCGATNKVHLILRHKSPKTGEIEEKHLKSPPSALLDADTHVYTAILRPDNTYAVLIDGEEKKAGSILEDFDPAVNPPEEIDDSEDKKPEEWVDTAKIADPEASKPDDWDEDAPRTIPDEDAEKPEGWLDDEPAKVDDPDAKQPEEWDEEEDGQWEPPQIPNPKCKEAPGCGEWVRPTKPNPAYKGKWNAPMIDNPEYKGVWKPRKIPNPDYYNDEEPLKNIGKVGGVAIEIWTMDDGIYFSDVVVANDASVAEEYRTQTYEPKKAIEEAAKAKKAEEDKKKAEEEDAKKQDEKAESSATGIMKVVNEVSEVVGEKINEAFDTVFGISFLAPYKQALEGPLVALTGTPLILLPAVLIITLLSLTLISRALFGGSKAAAGSQPVSAAEAKKQDITPVNDEAEEEEEEEDEDETDKADDKKGTTRRRAPRRDT